MTDRSDDPARTSAVAEEAMHLTLDAPFEDAVPYVQLEHEFVGFETIQVTRLDSMIEGMLGEAYPRTALLVMCHAELARDALEIDPKITSLLPCTTTIYERPGEDLVHVHHLSATKAIRDLGCAPAGSSAAVQALVELTGEYMDEVWTNIESNAAIA